MTKTKFLLMTLLSALINTMTAWAISYPTYRPSTPQYNYGNQDRRTSVGSSASVAGSGNEQSPYSSSYQTQSFPVYQGDLAVPMGQDNGYSSNTNENGAAYSSPMRGPRRAVDNKPASVWAGVVVLNSCGQEIGYVDGDGRVMIYNDPDNPSEGATFSGLYYWDGGFYTWGDMHSPIGENMWVLLLMALALACGRWAYNYNWKKEK